MLQIELSEKAESDLDAIHEYYAPLVGFQRADAVLAEIFASIEQLETFPGMGCSAQNPDVRELVLDRYPFAVSYIVKRKIVYIARILHECCR
ncbi:type II toxin-antitoxin system RelE/ParE family toxin [Pseudomonas sp. Pseusp122]|uniref:type II toxin-antitoxin system RelE/ParE family toxin n=1 Tax=unclassified Pseudomonas TaxID=196821 RepID=UPI0039A639BA